MVRVIDMASACALRHSERAHIGRPGAMPKPGRRWSWGAASGLLLLFASPWPHPHWVQPVDVTTVLEYNIAENKAARAFALLRCVAAWPRYRRIGSRRVRIVGKARLARPPCFRANRSDAAALLSALGAVHVQ